jgi:hypothetical protein
MTSGLGECGVCDVPHSKCSRNDWTEMAYEIRQSGDNYEVINKDTQEVKATHEPPDAKSKAERQVELLDKIENDPGWDE